NFTGTISGTGSVIKNTTGTLTLAGANTYSGGTAVSAGVLAVNNISGSGTGSGDVTVSGGTLGGTGTIAGNIILAGGTLSPGNSVGTLIAGGATLTSGTLGWELAAPGTSDLLTSPNLTINGGSVSLTDAGGLAAGTYTLIDYTGTVGGTGVGALGTPTGPGGF